MEIRQNLEDEDPSLVQQYPLPDRRFLSIFFNQRQFFQDFGVEWL